MGICDRETIRILLDLLNPLHGSLDRQVSDQLTDEREIEPPRDRECASWNLAGGKSQMGTYDQWKTTDPREYEPEEELQQSELEMTADALRAAQTEIEELKDYINALQQELKKFDIKF